MDGAEVLAAKVAAAASSVDPAASSLSESMPSVLPDVVPGGEISPPLPLPLPLLLLLLLLFPSPSLRAGLNPGGAESREGVVGPELGLKVVVGTAPGSGSARCGDPAKLKEVASIVSLLGSWASAFGGSGNNLARFSSRVGVGNLQSATAPASAERASCGPSATGVAGRGELIGKPNQLRLLRTSVINGLKSR